jgi:adenine/guanine phosphoribosyltransferase-like PRPP-binding protein
VSDRDTSALIAAGGMRPGDAADDAALPSKYNGLADPAGAEQLGRLIAEQARPLQPSVVLVWEDPEDIVLGHVVARELGVRAVRAWNADGLVGQSSPLHAGDRALLVLDAVRDPRAVRAVQAVVDRDGGTLVGTAVLQSTEALADPTSDPGTIISLSQAERPSAQG